MQIGSGIVKMRPVKHGGLLSFDPPCRFD